LIEEKEAEVSKSTWLRGLKLPFRAVAAIGVFLKVLFTLDVLDQNRTGLPSVSAMVWVTR
jgi:hypothetical protein